MIQITKELAEAVIDKCIDNEWSCCVYCKADDRWHESEDCSTGTMICNHTPECIVTRAKLLLELEWGIKS